VLARWRSVRFQSEVRWSQWHRTITDMMYLQVKRRRDNPSLIDVPRFGEDTLSKSHAHPAT
jgi:hypothetical protein